MQRIGMRFDRRVIVAGLEAIYYVIEKADFYKSQKEQT